MTREELEEQLYQLALSRDRQERADAVREHVGEPFARWAGGFAARVLERFEVRDLYWDSVDLGLSCRHDYFRGGHPNCRPIMDVGVVIEATIALFETARHRTDWDRAVAVAQALAGPDMPEPPPLTHMWGK